MEFLFYLFVFMFGAVIGSFLNVVILRYNTGITLAGRSFCFSCRKQLTWRDLFPVASFICLLGKCRFCKSKISWQYFLVEVLTGIIFVLIFWSLGGVNAFFPGTLIYFEKLLLSVVVFSILIVIGVYDFKHQIIPDSFAYTFAALALFRILFLPQTFLFTPGMWDLFAGPILALPFAALWYFSKGTWMGLGDAKLILGMGWFLGLNSGFSAVVLSFWIGSIIGVFLILVGKFLNSSFTSSLLHKKITLKTEIPFAPFLILSFSIATFFPDAVYAVQRLFF